MSRKLVILPFYGEFGFYILNHIRWCYGSDMEENIICCLPGHECLYPHADAFFYDWINPLPDDIRSGDFTSSKSGWQQYDTELTKRLSNIYPDHKIVRPTYLSYWDTCDTIKFKPKVEHLLPNVDIVVAPRRRAFCNERNYRHWTNVVKELRKKYTVGIAGNPDYSFQLDADAYAWNHPGGHTEGTIDLLQNCKLFVSTDTGVGHLGAFLDTPMLVFRNDDHGYMGVIKKANQNSCKRLWGIWNDPRRLLACIDAEFDETTSICDCYTRPKQSSREEKLRIMREDKRFRLEQKRGVIKRIKTCCAKK